MYGKREEKDPKKEIILKAVMKANLFHTIADALEFIKENKTVYRMMYEALDMYDKVKK